jgi:hypothetical protein
MQIVKIDFGVGSIRAGATVDVVSDDVREGTGVPRKAYSMCGGEG